MNEATAVAPGGESWFFRPSSNLHHDLDELEKAVMQFKSGAISEAEFRAVRVPAGVYEQRESGTFMLRVRFPAGGVLPEQLRCLAETASTWGNGILHVTTRQEFQVHCVPLKSILPALRMLAAVGLSSKGGGGNTVRNITACPDSGVCLDQVFDVVPYAVAITERLLADPLALQLPRKYKIGFAACGKDCAGATVQDLGFIAHRQSGVEGFAVYVGGGLGGKSRVGTLLEPFIPAEDAALVAEAVERVFDRNGNRKNKHLARLRFLVERIGMEAFRGLYEKELAALRATRPPRLEIRPVPHRNTHPCEESRAGKIGNAFDVWVSFNVVPQKQPGFYRVKIPLTLGDLPSAQARKLVGIVAEHGDGALWATQSQNVGLRWIPASELPVIHEKLSAAGLASLEAPLLQNIVSCAGASTCRLGICLSRGLAKAVRHELTASELELQSFGDLTIHVSGCPNSCGRHPIANVGFSGAARRVNGRMVPFYSVQLGGRLEEGRTRLGVNVGALPAKNAPAFLHDLLDAWKKSFDASDFLRFVNNGGKKVAEDLLARHAEVSPFSQHNEFYYDWDADVPFSLAGRGQGECSAGVFDLIEVDLANARESQEAGKFYASTLSATKSLLITQRLQPKSDRETFELFQKYFVSTGLVDSALETVIATAAAAAGTLNPAEVFIGNPVDVATLVASVRMLYENMDSSLRFKSSATV